MERHFDHALAELKQKLLTMASHAEKAVSDAVSALVNRDLDLALAVKANDEGIVSSWTWTRWPSISSPKHRLPANCGS